MAESPGVPSGGGKGKTMNVSQIMTSNPACCTPDMTLRDVAQMMVDNDCGCIPVVESEANTRLMGVITDRDIACRAVAKGMDVNTTPASTCMTASPMTVRADMSVGECERIMREMRVRRVPVVMDDESCVGMVSQADVALACGPQEAGQVVQAVSRPYVS
jgi:CBS domain-containing protein